MQNVVFLMTRLILSSCMGFVCKCSSKTEYNIVLSSNLFPFILGRCYQLNCAVAMMRHYPFNLMVQRIVYQLTFTGRNTIPSENYKWRSRRMVLFLFIVKLTKSSNKFCMVRSFGSKECTNEKKIADWSAPMKIK